jgi:hypothetical protein
MTMASAQQTYTAKRVSVTQARSDERRQPVRTSGSRFALAFPLGVFLLTRLYDFVLFQLLSRGQPAVGGDFKPGYFVSSPLPAHPGYLGVITNWDGQWYESLATNGYPMVGHGALTSADALQAWAFPPAFPLLTRAVMWTGLSFPWAASVVSSICGALAMILLFRLLDRSAGRFVAASGVALVCCFISAPLLQAAYSESLGLLLLLTAFVALVERKYGLAVAAIVLLGFTRILTPPFAIVVGLHVVARYRRRDRDPLSRKDTVALVALGAVSMAGALAWSITANLLTRSSTGAASRPRGAFEGLNWFAQSYSLLGWVGPSLVGLVLVILILLSIRPSARAWGIEVRTWLWSYPLFIFAVTPMTTGILRYLLFCFPLGLTLVGYPTTSGARKTRALTVAAACLVGLALQWWWVDHSFVVHIVSLMP